MLPTLGRRVAETLLVFYFPQGVASGRGNWSQCGLSNKSMMGCVKWQFASGSKANGDYRCSRTSPQLAAPKLYANEATHFGCWRFVRV